MKKKYILHLFFSIVIFTISVGCSGAYEGFEDCHNTIMFKNNTQKTVYYVSTLRDNFLNYDPTKDEYAADYRVQAGEEKKVKIGISLSCWEQVIKSAEGNVYIYVYDAEYLESAPWIDARSNPIKKYTLNVSQLNKMNWTIVYPN